MLCVQHRKETIGGCQWCGKVLCPKCVVKKDGRKAYCAACSPKVASMLLEKQMNVLKEEKKVEDAAKKDEGYFNFSALRPRR